MKVEQFKNAITDIGNGLSPTGDWMPTLFLEKDGKIAIMGLVGMPDQDEGKDWMAGIITVTIAITNADAVCLIMSAWTAPPNPDGTITRPRDNPNRKEAITGYCMGVRGESDGEAMMMGYIQRSPDKHPVITDWTMLESEEENELTTKGRFPDAMRDGFRKADPTGHLGRLEAFFQEGKRKQDEGTSNP
jgi:hypothetical protein